ncbi:MAG: hypothetical protein JXP37_10225 [Coriobacteriia bacterium]|nr:hypothetical protein [Coriobacteriia bacterium]
MRRRIAWLELLVLATISVLWPPNVALGVPGASTTYVLRSSTNDDAYGVYGQVYRYDWLEPTYDNQVHNVSSLYIVDTEYAQQYGVEWFIETGFDNQLFWETYEQGTVCVFFAYSDPVDGSYEGPFRVVSTPDKDVWVSFEINNHSMIPPAPSDWYAAWNGHTFLHGLDFPDGRLREGQPIAASERWQLGDARSSFRYMQYKRIQGNYAPWFGMVTTDNDPWYDCWSSLLGELPVRFYMWRDMIAP